MKKIVLLLVLFMSIALSAQNNTIVIQQNSQQQNQPVKEKIVYKDRVVYVEKPQPEVLCIHGYLYVYPTTLGEYWSCLFQDVINSLNKNNSYGHNNWRLPTENEVEMMRAVLPDVTSRTVYWTRELVQDVQRENPEKCRLSNWYPPAPSLRLVCE